MSDIGAMVPADVEKVRALESEMIKLPQVNLVTKHVLHAGMYSRTILIPKGVVITGALIKIPTILTISGYCTIFIGGESKRLEGYAVLTGNAGRKQVFLAHADTHVTMTFPTSANSVEAAEREFTDEVELLLTRRLEG